MGSHQGFLEFIIGELVERVEIRANGAREEERILWDDGQARTQVGELDFGNVNAVNRNAA